MLVRAADEPAGCSEEYGWHEGWCQRSTKECRAIRYMNPCKPYDAYAWVDRALHTKGKTIELGSRTYGECVTRPQGMKEVPETVSVTDCVIFRYTPNP